MDNDAIEPPGPPDLPDSPDLPDPIDPESIVHTVYYSTIYHPFYHLVDQPDPDQPD